MANNVQNKNFASKYNISDYRAKPKTYTFSAESNHNKIIYKNELNRYGKILDVNCFNTCLKSIEAWKVFFQGCYTNVKSVRDAVDATKPIINNNANVALKSFDSLLDLVQKLINDFNSLDTGGCLTQAKSIREQNIKNEKATLRRLRDSEVKERAKNESDAGANLISEVVDYWGW